MNARSRRAGHSDRLEFRATVEAILFCLVFLFIGGFGFFATLTSIVSGLAYFWILAVTLVLFAGGWYLLYSFMTPIVFDKRTGLFWNNRKTQKEVLDWNSLENATNLGEIYALQLITCRGGRYISPELNLVLKNGARLHVVVYPVNQGRLRKDASILAGFLGVPLWDAT